MQRWCNGRRTCILSAIEAKLPEAPSGKREEVLVAENRCVNYGAGVRGEALGICAPLALGDAEGAVGAACGAGVGLVSGLVEGGVHVEAGRRRHLDADEVEALELDARDFAD